MRHRSGSPKAERGWLGGGRRQQVPESPPWCRASPIDQPKPCCGVSTSFCRAQGVPGPQLLLVNSLTSTLSASDHHRVSITVFLNQNGGSACPQSQARALLAPISPKPVPKPRPHTQAPTRLQAEVAWASGGTHGAHPQPSGSPHKPG